MGSKLMLEPEESKIWVRATERVAERYEGDGDLLDSFG